MSSLDLFKPIKLVVFDFDGVFTDNKVYVTDEGHEMVRCSRGDSFGIRLLEKLGIDSMVLSTEENPVVSKRCEKIKIKCVQGVWHKGPALAEIMEKAGLTREQVAYVGNDINDIPCFELVGLPIAVADSHPALDGLSLFRTSANGGDGAVREVCDLINTAHGGDNKL